MKSILLILCVCGVALAQSFPGSIYTPLLSADNVQTALTSPMLAGDGVAIVASTTGFLSGMAAYICETTTGTGAAQKCTAFEVMKVTNVAPNVLTVTRGFGGTSAIAHATGKIVQNAVTSVYTKSVNDETVAIETALGVNLSNIPGSPSGSAVPVNKGGTGATTQSGAFAAIVGAAAVPVSLGGTGATSAPAALTALGVTFPVPVAQGGSGVGLAQGAGTGTKVQLAAGAATSGNVPKFDSSGALIDSGITPSTTPTGSSPNQRFVSGLGPSFSGIFRSATADTTYSQDYNFPAQIIGTTVGAGGTVTAGLAPCPLGVAGTDTVHHLYVSGGTGTAEAVLITGGTCTSGASGGTVTFTVGNAHSGSWTVQSASSGIQEAIYVAGATGAVQMPAGVIPYYSTITVPSGYNTCLTGQGISATILSGNVATTSAIDGIVYDSVSGAYGTVCTGAYTIGPASGINTAGALVKTRYRTDGQVHDIYTANGWDGYWMERNARAVWQNINGGNARYGLRVTCNGVAYPDCVNEGTVIGGHLTAGSNSANVIRIEAPTSGILLSGLFTEGGSFTTCISVNLVPVGTNPFNEITIQNSVIDGCTTGVQYVGNGASYVGNYVMVQNSEINASNAGVICNSFCQNVSLVGDVIGVFGGVGSDRAVILGGSARNIYIANNSQINSDGDAFVLTQGVVTNLDISGNTFGVLGQPTSCFSFGGTTSHVNVRNNNFLGNAGAAGCTGIYTGSATTWSMAGNTGIDDITPAVASAGTLAFPVNPTFTLTGTTGVTAVTVPLIAGSKYTFVATTAGPGAWTAGATIGNTFTPTINVPVTCTWDGTKIYCRP